MCWKATMQQEMDATDDGADLKRMDLSDDPVRETSDAIEKY